MRVEPARGPVGAARDRAATTAGRGWRAAATVAVLSGLTAAVGSAAAASASPAAAPMWSFDVGASVWALAAAVLYWVLARRLRGLPTPGQVLSFVSGLAVVVVALSSPLDTMGETVLLTMHMLEHMALTLVGALLLVLGIPRPMLERVLHLPVFGAALRRVWNLSGMLLYNVVILLWHVPFLYEAALRHEPVHDFEHLCFLLFGVLFWGAVIKPVAPARGRSGAPFRRLVGVLVALGVNTGLGSYLFFAQHALYPTYVDAPRVWGLIDVVTDQSIAGASLWVMGDMAYIIAAVLLVAEWLQGVESPAPRHAAE